MYKRPPVKDNSKSINYSFSNATAKQLESDRHCKLGSKQEKSEIRQASVRSKERSKDLDTHSYSKELSMAKSVSMVKHHSQLSKEIG